MSPCRTPARSRTCWAGNRRTTSARAHFLVEPTEKLSVLLTGDYLNSRGTGSRGVDFFHASRQGLTWDDFDDPRKVNMISFSPVQDTDHWGASLNATYRTDLFNVQYIGGYRDLHYTNSLPTGGATSTSTATSARWSSAATWSILTVRSPTTICRSATTATTAR